MDKDVSFIRVRGRVIPIRKRAKKPIILCKSIK